MNIVTESHLQGQPIGDKARKRPVRMVRWFIVIGLLLSLLVGGLVWFNYFRGKMIAQFFANNKPPAASVSIAKTQAIISQKLVKAPFDGELGVRKVEVGQYLTAGTQIVSLTDLSQLYANFTVTEKDSGALKVGQTVRIAVDAYPGRKFEGKITTIEPQIATDTRNIRVQATLANPDRILKPGMFTTTTVVLPAKPPVITV